MSLVSDLIVKVVDSSSVIGQVLQKAKVLASELKSPELRTWVDSELTGYDDEDSLPDCRISVGMNLGHFEGGFGSAIRNAPLPIYALPEEFRAGMSKLRLTASVSSLQEMHNLESTYQESWSADLIALVSSKFYQGMALRMAWKHIPQAEITGVLDTARNKLLSFLLELKEQYPEVEDADAGLRAIPSDEVRISIANNIFGTNNNLASGQSVQQTVNQNVKQGDIDALLSVLAEASLPEESIDELKVAISEDESISRDGLGPKVSIWMAKLAEKIGTNATATLAAQAVLQFYGIS
jgi:hypothetical protein